MLGGIFSERGMVAVEKGLAALSLRHRVIADNVANLNTPGYKRGDVSFAEQLTAYLDDLAARKAARANGGNAGDPLGATAASAPRAPEAFTPQFYRVNSAGRLDGNNVDIEAEMARLAENALLYEAASRQASVKLGLLRLAITEGRR